jgi:ankyrin repeat protein
MQQIQNNCGAAVPCRRKFGVQTLVCSVVAVLAWSSVAFCGEIHEAVRAKDIEKVKTLLTKGADVNAMDEWVKGDRAQGLNRPLGTPLHYAAQLNSKDIAALLLDRGVNVNAKDASGITPVPWAISYDFKEIVKLLRQHGAQLTIHDAGMLGDLATVKEFLDKGTDVNARGGSEKTPLLLAVQRRREELVKLLLAKGADPNAKDNDQRTSLHFAAMDANKEIIEILLANGADVHARDYQGKTPLLWVGTDSKEIVKLLLVKGAGVNEKDTNGYTPLHRAASGDFTEMAQSLLAKGADVNAKNERGETPLQLAVKQGSKEVADLLRKHGAKE